MDNQDSTAQDNAGNQDGGHIGTAEMKEDGTIILLLRAEGPGGIVGDARLVYQPSHDRYTHILDHVGPLAPGEEKLVKPFPSSSS